MARYYPTGEDTWLSDRRGATKLILNDGSVWEVAAHDNATIEHWTRFSTMGVIEHLIGERSVYVLVNKSFGAQVRARFLGMRQELGAA